MNMKSRFSRLPAYLLALFLSASVILSGCGTASYSNKQITSPGISSANTQTAEESSKSGSETGTPSKSLTGSTDSAASQSAAGTSAVEIRYGDLVIPAYSGEPYTVLTDNVPTFDPSEETTTAFESYHDLDSLGRCGAAYACLGKELMPTEKRGDISQVKPTGWHSIRYEFVDGGSLYNRCHLIGFQLSGENANEKNLVTGTRYLNVDGMLPFENMTADYIKETGNHVLYRVTPVFTGDNLVCDGVIMEAKSMEDDGDGILFHVFCYNVQPGVSIDYATGDASETGDSDNTANASINQAAAQAENNSSEKAQVNADASDAVGTEADYVLNTNTKKFHLPSCPSASDISPENRTDYHGTRESLIQGNYTPCGRCKP